MKVYMFCLLLGYVFLIDAVNAEFDLNEVGCGLLLDNYLIDNSSFTFSATSGDPGRPLLSGQPWKPTNISFQNSLTVDLGQNYSVTRIVWSGDPTKVEQTNLMALQYSYDGITYDCRRKALAPAVCNPYFGQYPPPVASNLINHAGLGQVITARFFRFIPVEPDPGKIDGAHNLRIDLRGCVQFIPEIDIVFLLSATSTVTADANAAFAFMKNTVKEFVTLYGMTYVKYGLIVFGTPVNNIFNLAVVHANKAALKTAIDGAAIATGTPNLASALSNAKTMLQGAGSRPNARKIVITMMDKSSGQTKAALNTAAKSLRDIEALVIGIGIGTKIPIQELDWITLNRYYVMMFPWGGSYRHLCLGMAARCFKEFDITFAVGAASVNSVTFYKLMKDTMGAIILKYGIRTIHYSIVTYGLGSASASVVHSFTSTGSSSSSAALKATVDAQAKPGGSGGFAIDSALSRCQRSFNDASVRRNADRDVVLMTDKSSSINSATLRSLSYTLGASGLRIIPVGIGKDINRNELLAMSSNSEDVIHVTDKETATNLELKVMHNVYRLYMLNYDMTFIIYASSSQSSSYYSYMQNVIRSIIQRYGYGRCKYTFIVYGSTAVTYYKFDTIFPNLEMLLRGFARIARATGGVASKFSQALDEANNNFIANSRTDAWKVLVLMMDKKSGMNKTTLRDMIAPIEDMGVLIVPVCMGREIDPSECYYYSTYRDTVVFASDYRQTSYLTTSEIIMNSVVRFEYVDLAFVINADSASSVTTFTIMKHCMLKMIGKFGVYRFRYSVIIYGTSFTKHVDFGTTFPYRGALISIVSGVTKQSGSSGIITALRQTSTIFGTLPDRRSIRGLAVIMDKPSGASVINLQNAVKPLVDNGVVVVASSVGGDPSYDELRALTISRKDVIQVSSKYSAALLGDNIAAKILKDGVAKVDFVFALSLSDDSDQLTILTKNIITQIIMRYGIYRFHYSIIVYGSTSTIAFDFSSILPDKQSILNAIKSVKRLDQTKQTNDKLAFDQAWTIFTTKPTREEARKVFVVMTDKPSVNSPSELKTAGKRLQDIGVTVVTVGLGPNVPFKQLLGYGVVREHVIYVPSGGVSYILADKIINRITGSGGSHEITINTWRPLGNGTVPELKRFFIGGSPELEDSTYPQQPVATEEKVLSKFYFRTTTTGSVTVRLNVVQQCQEFMESKKAKKRTRSILDRLGGLSALDSLGQVMDAFQRARKRMVAARDGLLLVK